MPVVRSSAGQCFRCSSQTEAVRELVEGELDVAGVGPDLAPELGQLDQQIEIRVDSQPPRRVGGAEESWLSTGSLSLAPSDRSPGPDVISTSDPRNVAGAGGALSPAPSSPTASGLVSDHFLSQVKAPCGLLEGLSGRVG